MFFFCGRDSISGANFCGRDSISGAKISDREVIAGAFLSLRLWYFFVVEIQFLLLILVVEMRFLIDHPGTGPIQANELANFWC